MCVTGDVLNCFYDKTPTGWQLAKKSPLLGFKKAPICETCGVRTPDGVIICKDCAPKNYRNSTLYCEPPKVMG